MNRFNILMIFSILFSNEKIMYNNRQFYNFFLNFSSFILFKVKSTNN